MKRDISHYRRKVHFWGRVVWWTGAVRLFADGDCISTLWRWWHPVTWLHYVVLTPVCGIVGEPVTEVIPVRLNRFWRERRDQIEWFRP